MTAEILRELRAVADRMDRLEHRSAIVLGELGRLRSEVRAARLETAEAHGVALRAVAEVDATERESSEVDAILADDSRRLDSRLARVERDAIRRSGGAAAAIAGGVLAAIEIWRALAR